MRANLYRDDRVDAVFCSCVWVILKQADYDNRPPDKSVVVVGFVALRPKSTAMVIAGRSVHLTTLFPGQG